MLRYLHQGETPRVVDDQFVSPNWCPMIAEAVEHVISGILHDTYRGYRRPTGAGCYADAVASNRVKAQPWGVYHLTGNGYTTWYEFARLIFEKTAKLWNKPLIVPQPVGTEEFGAVAKRPAYSVMNPEKFTRTFDNALPDWQTQFLHCVNVMTDPSPPPVPQHPCSGNHGYLMTYETTNPFALPILPPSFSEK
jgi:dTDP-4-dehydrorhamnose reductase